MDTYCLVREGASHYGGLIAWTLDSGVLALQLDPRAAVALHLPVELAIPVTGDAEAVLQTTLGKTDGLMRRHGNRRCH